MSIELTKQVTQYLERIALLEQRLNKLERTLVTHQEVQEAWESHRNLYTDMFQETHAIRDRLWKLGTLDLALTQNMTCLRLAHVRVCRQRGTNHQMRYPPCLPCDSYNLLHSHHACMDDRLSAHVSNRHPIFFSWHIHCTGCGGDVV